MREGKMSILSEDDILRLGYNILLNKNLIIKKLVFIC